MKTLIALIGLVALSICSTVNAASVEYKCTASGLILAKPTTGLSRWTDYKENEERLHALSMDTDGTGDVIHTVDGTRLHVIEDFIIDRSDDWIRWTYWTDAGLYMLTLWTKTGVMHKVLQMVGEGTDEDATILETANCEIKR